MKKHLVAVRLSEHQSAQLSELEQAGYGNQSDIIRTALDRMHQEEKRNMKWEKEYRNNLINNFNGMNLGYLEKINDLSTKNLENMVGDLSEAQDAGTLNLETDEGIDNLKTIIDKYVN